MTGNANELAKSLIFRLENLMIEATMVKEDMEAYLNSNHLDFTEYDKTFIRQSIDHLLKIKQEIEQERLGLKVLSGN